MLLEEGSSPVPLKLSPLSSASNDSIFLPLRTKAARGGEIACVQAIWVIKHALKEVRLSKVTHQPHRSREPKSEAYRHIEIRSLRLY